MLNSKLGGRGRNSLCPNRNSTADFGRDSQEKPRSLLRVVTVVAKISQALIQCISKALQLEQTSPVCLNITMDLHNWIY